MIGSDFGVHVNPFAALSAQGQACFTVQPIDTLVVDHVSFAAEQDGQTTIPKPWSVRSKCQKAFDKYWRCRYRVCLIPHCGPLGANEPTGTPLRQRMCGN
jgi:hypothetical protein